MRGNFGSGNRRGARKGPRWNNGLTRRIRRHPTQTTENESEAKVTKKASLAKQQPNNDAEGSDNDSAGEDAGAAVADYEVDDENEQLSAAAKRFEQSERESDLDRSMGFELVEGGPVRPGWLINFTEALVRDQEWPSGRSAIKYYFLQDDGRYFTAVSKFSSYFYVKCKVDSKLFHFRCHPSRWLRTT